MTPLTPAAVTALAQQAAESPAHLDPVLVQQVCQEWVEQRKDIAFHAECRPNRRQAEAAMADAKATNDRWADAIRELDAALAERQLWEDTAMRRMEEAEHAEAALTEARRVLREVERAGWLASCPCCGWNVQHRDTCALSAVLAQEETR